jgi:Xaa-Pro aminopeptidase
MPPSTTFDLAAVQAAIRGADIDGWLLYDFRNTDPIARNVLGLEGHAGSRRWFYFVPSEGAPRKLVHAIESKALDAVPGDATIYLTWQSLDEGIGSILGDSTRVAMNYSPQGDVPYVSKVDAGTVEKVRSKGVEVVSSADLMQAFEAVLSEEQLASHHRAAKRIRDIVDEVFALVGETLRAGKTITERDIVNYANSELRAAGMINDHDPIVGVNEHAADPHFEVAQEGSSEIRVNDLLLFDIWAREEAAGSIYADITWCAFVGGEAPEEIVKVFNIVRDARKAACQRADEAFRAGDDIRGFELDRAARKIIDDAGYGEYFIHRLGHSIHENTHGNGANLDDLETHDTRKMLPGTLFSVEPGIYLPGKFGIRSEVDVYHTGNSAEITGAPHQEDLVRIEV